MAESESSSSPDNRNPVAEKRKCSEMDDCSDSEDEEGRKVTAREGKEESAAEDEKTRKKKKQLFTFQMTTASTEDAEEKRNKNTGPICLKLGIQKTKETPNVVKTSASVAKAFNDDEEEAEEMPPEARMRMRNIGRDTPTSAGPNSFGKTRQGFCDTKKMFEKQIKKKMEDVSF